MVTMLARRFAWLTLVPLGGCTQTAEVLTKRIHDDQSPPPPSIDAAVAPLDAATGPAFTDGTRPHASSDPRTTEPEWTQTDTTSSDTDSPETRLLEAPPLAVGAGHNATCAILNNSRLNLLWCIGETETQETDGNEDPNDLSRGDFVHASGGERHMCALDTLGEVFCWGDNSNGQLGNDQVGYSTQLRRVRLPRAATQISSGASHVCAITDQADLYCWGNNAEGQLGIGSFEEEDRRDLWWAEPTLVGMGPWIAVAAGHSHTCGVRSDGTLSCWGRNVEGQVGNHGVTQLTEPTLVNSEHSWREAVAGESHSCGLRTDGTLWCWGSNSTENAGYPLGVESSWQLAEPTQVGDQRWQDLATSSFHTCAVTENRELWCWGRNDEGQLGMGDTVSRTTPTFVRDDVSGVATGRFHTCIVTGIANDVMCTGSNEFGQLALPDDAQHSTFTSLTEEWSRYLGIEL